jgi:hypothetical protein
MCSILPCMFCQHRRGRRNSIKAQGEQLRLATAEEASSGRTGEGKASIFIVWLGASVAFVCLFLENERPRPPSRDNSLERSETWGAAISGCTLL